MKAMASIVIFLEVLEWTWHYDLSLDSLILLARNSFRLYIFFRCAFSTLVVSGNFDLQYLFNDLPLHYAHPIHFLALTPFASSMESDPFEEILPRTVLLVAETSSSFTGTQVVPKMWEEEDAVVAVLENRFHIS